jgi:hypothetical protein
MRNFLMSMFYLGWPVRIRGNCEAGVEERWEWPVELSLQVYPNPGRHGANLRFGLPVSGRVRVGVYDVRGRCVVEVADDMYEAGWHNVVWEGRNTSGRRVSPGVYFVRLSVGEKRTTRKVLLVQ